MVLMYTNFGKCVEIAENEIRVRESAVSTRLSLIVRIKGEVKVKSQVIIKVCTQRFLLVAAVNQLLVVAVTSTVLGQVPRTSTGLVTADAQAREQQHQPTRV
jgi:hypothetical protein